VASIASGREVTFANNLEDGAAPNANIHAIRLTNNHLNISVANSIRGFEEVADDPDEVVAANYSAGGGLFPAGGCNNRLRRPAMIRLRAVGVLPIVATGNAGNAFMMADPACIPEAISVAANIDAGSMNAPISNRSADLDFLAPGTNIVTATTTNDTQAVNPPGLTGTSFAAPHITGAVAVLAQSRSVASSEQILDALRLEGTSRIDPVTGRLFRFPDVLLAKNRLANRLDEILASNSLVSRNTVSNSPVTIFSKIENDSGSTLFNCEVRPPHQMNLDFSYQRFNPSTGNFIGTANVPFNLGAGVEQTLVLTFTPTAEIQTVQLEPTFDCDDEVPASLIPGGDTLLFSAIPNGTPTDIISVPATATQDRTLRVPGVNGVAVYTVAATNINSSSSNPLARITVTDNWENLLSGLPLTLRVCETNSAGICTGPLATTFTTRIARGTSKFFAVYAWGQGSTVPLVPQEKRVFLNITRGSSFFGGDHWGTSSVAVTTN